MTPKTDNLALIPGYPEIPPGHDGNPPIFELIRDPDGKDKRELIRERRLDTIGILAKRDQILPYQAEAAWRLQRDAERAEIRTASTLGSAPVSRSQGPYSLSDGKLNAMASHADAREAVRKALGVAGSRGETLLRLVVIENCNLETAGKIMSIPAREVSNCLRFALDVLARHYGLG